MRLSVKELAEFVHRRGDIRHHYQSATLAQEGIARQKAYQQDRGESYQREFRVSATFGELEISGRIDGWDAQARLVEEVKTTRSDPVELHDHAGEVHLAQLRLYGSMLVLADETLDELTLRLVYLHPASADETAFEETARHAELIGYFETTCATYAAWITNVRARLAERDRQLAALAFPYGEFRADQRRIAKHLYRAFRDGADWLVEAPTGSGKTMAGLYAALKAMGAGELDRLVFLTSRTTGQRAMEDALGDAVEAVDGDAALTAVTITATDRICFDAGASCDRSECEYARGYYERMPAARRQLLGHGLARLAGTRAVQERFATPVQKTQPECEHTARSRSLARLATSRRSARLVCRADVEAVAREHGVCPFELSLDVMAWADVVVCDYNYVFDPIVHLARLDNAVFARVGVIVDEAHQLGDRIRDMLGSRLSRLGFKAALAEHGLPEPVAKGMRSVDRALGALGQDTSEDERVIPEPVALLRAIERLLAARMEAPHSRPGASPAKFTSRPLCAGSASGPATPTSYGTTAAARAARSGVCSMRVAIDGERFPATSAAYFEVFQFGHLAASADEGNFHYMASGTGRETAVELVCTVPGDHIRETLARFQGRARVSGSLTPASVFQRIHGAGDSDNILVSDGCFPPEHLGVFLVTDVSTYYRDRDRTLSRVAALILGVTTQTTGNYLVAFPSFEYLEAVAAAVDGVDGRCQRPDMTLDEREEFIRWICEPRTGRVGFVVMGGVFAESVDFEGGALDGVIVVGAGLPPRTLKRDLIASDSVQAGLGFDGDQIAYRQPAMTRVVQAAGRVVRSATDRGVVVLVDPRFANSAYRAFLPARWWSRTVRADSLALEVGGFWFGEHAMQRRTPA